jgi:uncharacterized protein (TIGR02145 family)
MKALKLFSLLVCICVSTLDAQTVMNIHQSNGTVLQIPLNTIDSITYTINNPGLLATLSTLAIGNVTGNTATSGGNITNDGGTNITQRGVVWSTNPNPTTANNFTNNGIGMGSFTSNLTGLISNTTYYIRAYATNSAGTAYGNQLSVTTTGGGNGIVSTPGAGVTFDGYTYPSIVLGNGQEWTAENLRTTKYANGDVIPIVTNAVQWENLITGAWCNYDNNSTFESLYGKLYNWYAVADARNICPSGWHVPTDNEWGSLINYLDPSSDGFSSNNIAGGKMKSTGTQFWFMPNQDASNESGFSGLPGGVRDDNSDFNGINEAGAWWSSSEIAAYPAAWCRFLTYGYGDAERYDAAKYNGLSVRCLRD